MPLTASGASAGKLTLTNVPGMNGASISGRSTRSAHASAAANGTWSPSAFAGIDLAERDRPHARERALHRRRDGSRIGHVFGEVRAAVDAGQDEVGRAVLHDMGQRHHHGVGRRPADRKFPVSMAAQADGAGQRQRVAGARLLFGGSDDPDVIGKLRRDGFEHRKPGRVDAVIIGEKDAHRGYPMRIVRQWDNHLRRSRQQSSSLFGNWPVSPC